MSDEIPVSSGIYQITNTVSGNRYVGSAVNLRDRWRKHRGDLRKNVHRNSRLQRSWNKHGESVFAFIVLEPCARVELIAREQAAIDDLKPEYNISMVAGSSLGIKRSAETKAKIGVASRGRKLSAEHIRILQTNTLGRKWTPEQRAKLSAVCRLQSVEKRAKIGAASRGRRHSPESRAKISAAQKGRKRSPEARAKGAASNTGGKRSDESKEKMRRSALARSHDTSAALKAYWSRRRAAKEQSLAVRGEQLELGLSASD